MSKEYVITDIEDTINKIKSDFPGVEVSKISGIPIKDNHLLRDEQKHAFIPIYFGTKIIIPYSSSGTIIPVNIENQVRTQPRYAPFLELFISRISGLTDHDLYYLGLDDKISHKILTLNIYDANNVLPKELSEDDLLTAVKIGRLTYSVPK